MKNYKTCLFILKKAFKQKENNFIYKLFFTLFNYYEQ